MRLTFLGTGTSFGVPQIGCHCEVCRSPDPRDKRTRVGAYVETRGGTRILIDTPPELRLQLVANGIDRVTLASSAEPESPFPLDAALDGTCFRVVAVSEGVQRSVRLASARCATD